MNITQRLDMSAVAPDGFKAVFAMEAYVRKNVPSDLLHLVKLRASTINGCAFCVDMHATDALGDGEHVRRVTAVAAWRESPFFDERERLALELTDAVTRLDEHGVPDDVWSQAIEQFGDRLTADLVMAVATINVWNRIAVSTRIAPPPLES